jgi:hypothetical protein
VTSGDSSSYTSDRVERFKLEVKIRLYVNGEARETLQSHQLNHISSP